MPLRHFDNRVVLTGALRQELRSILCSLGVAAKFIETHESAKQAEHSVVQNVPTLLVLTLDASSTDELDFLDWLQTNGHKLPSIVVARDCSASVKIAAILKGAIDFIDLGHAYELDRFGSRITQALVMHEEKNLLRRASDSLREHTGDEFIGSSNAIEAVYQRIIGAAKSNASVFITGENGTGKDVCATLIHKHSLRSEQALMTLNCAAIPHGLAESELFGHVKGSFTGAVSDRIGMAKMAHEGSLFLDEIGEMDLDIQSKLLRFVQTGMFSMVGNSHTEQVNTRFICATNQDPAEQIRNGTFRQDLFYRLNVIQIHIPPLRERGEDILLFAKKFLSVFAEREGKRFTDISPEAEVLMRLYSWPGNVRELQNVIQSIVVLFDGNCITPAMLPLPIVTAAGYSRRKSDYSSDDFLAVQTLKETASILLDEHELDVLSNRELMGGEFADEIVPLNHIIDGAINRAIDLCNGNVAEASQKLGVSASTVYRRLKA
ncbi:MAG: sigma-54 dependent transcriptional regulator [Pseudomonadales bacterium]